MKPNNIFLTATIVGLLVLILACLTTGQNIRNNEDDNQNCDFKDISRCFFLENLTSAAGFRWPTNVASVNRMCRDFASGGECLSSFNEQCNQQEVESRNFLNGIQQGLALQYDKICLTRGERERFLSRIRCFRNAALIRDLNNIHRRFVGMIERIANSNEPLEWQRASCCAIIYWQDRSRRVNAKYCDSSDVEYVNDLVTSIFSYPIEETCGTMNNFQECFSTLSDQYGADMNQIATAARPPTTRNLLAFPTLFRMWSLTRTSN